MTAHIPYVKATKYNIVPGDLEEEIGWAIGDAANDTLDTLREAIDQAVASKRSSVQVEVSYYFDIPGINPSAARNRVYYIVFQCLEQSGYNCRIGYKEKNGNTRAYMQVRWRTKKEMEEDKEINEYLKKRTIQF